MTSPQSEHRPARREDEAAPHAPVHLATNENWFRKYLEGDLSGEESQALDEHRAICPECNLLCGQWQALDSELERALKCPELSPAFAFRLGQRIAAEPAAAGQAERAQRREQIEAEIAAHWLEIQRRFLRAQWPRLFDGLGYATAAALCGYYLIHAGSSWMEWPGKLGTLSSNDLAWAVAVATGAIALLAGCWFATRNQVARWLASFGAEI